MSRRLGITPQVLRAWERRYGLLNPQRTAGGYRLYSEEDERRVRALLRHLEEGCSTAEAARMALRDPDDASLPVAVPAALDALARVRERLLSTLIGSDEQGAQGSLDELFAITDLDGALVGAVLPVLTEIGNRWAGGEISIATEHYATNILQSRLLSLARGWDQGSGPQAILACLPDEHHAIGLIAFGLVLRRRGWRIAYLGADTPVASVGEWVDRLAPSAVVMASVFPDRFERVERELGLIAGRVRLVLGGAGSSPALAARVGAIACAPDPCGTADMLTAAVAG